MKLPRPQLHLTTCIILMFVAGGLVCANMVQKAHVELPYHGLTYFDYGWPMIVYRLNQEADRVPPIATWHFSAIGMNTLAALAILTVVALVCEWLVRRRKFADGADSAKKRPRLQLHLSTCILLMFVAGVILWANVRLRLDSDRGLPIDPLHPQDGNVRGWPMIVKYEPDIVEDPALSVPDLVINLATALAILTTTAIGCENLLRRRRKI
jgi:hypothetical protein